VGEFIADLRQQSGAKRVLLGGTPKRTRTAFRNWFSGDVDLFQRQARRASDVAP
jgi:hypothetical protein